METTQGALLDDLVEVSRVVSWSVLEVVCRALEALPEGASVRDVMVLVPVGHARQKLLRLATRWEQEEGLSPLALSWGLQAASRTARQVRLEQQLELVWTGPNPERSGLRRIDQVLLSMLREARESILLVTYASYKVPVIREALWDAVERGVSLRLVVESHEKEDGARGLDPTRAYGKELVERADVLVWPLVNRERDENNRFGVLHVKSAVVDGAQMLLSSANLTGSAMTMNMELGLLIKGGELPGRVEAHITSLVRHGVLEAWPSEA